jgi:hypothetical protein
MPRKQAAAAEEVPPPPVDATLLILRQTANAEFALRDGQPEPTGGHRAHRGSSSALRPTLVPPPEFPKALQPSTPTSKSGGQIKTLLPVRNDVPFFVADTSGGAPPIRMVRVTPTLLTITHDDA